MAVTADRVVVELEARLGRYEANVARAERNFDKSMAGIQKSAGRAEAVVSRAMGGIGAALAGVSAIALARTFLQIADEAKKLDAQLRLATQGFGNFSQAQEDVRRIANETRTGLSETATLYSNFQRNARELGISQEQAARATETVGKAFKISGASAVDSAQGTRQLVQALQSGVLRGDEFNSMAENAPRLQKLLADSLGVSQGALRAMAEEGELTSDKLTRAFTDKNFTKSIDAEFKEIPVTFDEAMTQVYNSAVITFGAFDRGGEFSTILASFVTGGAEGFGDLEAAAVQFGVNARGAIEGLAGAFGPIFDEAKRFFEYMNVNLSDFSFSIEQELADLDKVGGWLSRQGTLGGLLSGNSLSDSWNGRATGTNFRGRYVADRDASMARSQSRIAIQDNANTSWGRIFAAAMSGNIPTPARPRPAASAGKKAGGRGRTPRSPLDADAFAREEAQLNDEILSLKADEIVNIEERTLAEAKRIETAKLAATEEIKGDKRFTEAQKEKLVALLGTVTALQSARVFAERDAQVAKNALDVRLSGIRNDEDLLRAQAELTDGRQARTEIELRLIDLAYEQERAELEGTIASKEAAEAQKRIAQKRLDILGQLEGADKEGVRRRGESPIDRRRRDLNDPDRIGDQLENYVLDELDHVQDSISSAITKKLGVKDPLLEGLINLFIEQQIMRPLFDAFSSASGGAGLVGGSGFGALFKAIGIPGFASGGGGILGGRGGTDRNTLSLNGRPIANVSRGESLNVGSKALSGRGGSTTVVSAPQFDLRGAVMTRELYADMERISRANAARAASQSYQQSMRDAPGAVAKRQRYGV